MTGLDSARVVFRVDASLQIGTGHVMRCLTLADALRARGATCRFISRDRPGHPAEAVRARGHDLVLLSDVETPRAGEGHDDGYGAWLGCDGSLDAEQTIQAIAGSPVDWLVVDHYALDRQWERALRPHVRSILVIDDLANRTHDADLLLDQNLGRRESDYAPWIAAPCVPMIGPQHALLQPRFAQLREASLARRQSPRLSHLLITMGGIDAGNASGAVLDALRRCRFPEDLQITVVMGPASPALDRVRDAARQMPWPTDVRVGESDMAGLMSRCDLAIGAAGVTAWERCCLGLPSLLVVLADNQISGARALEAQGAALLVGAVQDVPERLPQMIRDGTEPRILAQLSTCAARVTDGLGAARVLSHMEACHA